MLWEFSKLIDKLQGGWIWNWSVFFLSTLDTKHYKEFINTWWYFQMQINIILLWIWDIFNKTSMDPTLKKCHKVAHRPHSHHHHHHYHHHFVLDTPLRKISAFYCFGKVRQLVEALEWHSLMKRRLHTAGDQVVI